MGLSQEKINLYSHWISDIRTYGKNLGEFEENFLEDIQEHIYTQKTITKEQLRILQGIYDRRIKQYG